MTDQEEAEILQNTLVKNVGETISVKTITAKFGKFYQVRWWQTRDAHRRLAS